MKKLLIALLFTPLFSNAQCFDPLQDVTSFKALVEKNMQMNFVDSVPRGDHIRYLTQNNELLVIFNSNGKVKSIAIQASSTKVDEMFNFLKSCATSSAGQWLRIGKTLIAWKKESDTIKELMIE